MVFCYECDTLYHDLLDLRRQGSEINNFDPSKPIFVCPKCGSPFEYYFMKNPQYQVGRAEWIKQGYAHLLCQ